MPEESEDGGTMVGAEANSTVATRGLCPTGWFATATKGAVAGRIGAGG
jgi:hypothetical protein